MKQTGIWIDKRVAIVVTLQNEEEHLNKIHSSIEEYRPKGGSGTRLKGGPQDVVQDSKFTEREKHQQKKFFGTIADYMTDADEIVIFGPAEMGKKLKSDMEESNKALYSKVKEVRSADSMTDNQVRAWVRDYFRR